jgi:hypothetical protein
MPVVTCPCCDGKKKILVFSSAEEPEPEGMIIVSQEICAHCQGAGKIEAEVEENGSK